MANGRVGAIKTLKFQAPGIQKTDKTQRHRDSAKHTVIHIYKFKSFPHGDAQTKRTNVYNTHTHTHVLTLLHKIEKKLDYSKALRAKKAHLKKGSENRADGQMLPPIPWLGSLMSPGHYHLRVHWFFWLPWTQARGWCFPCHHRMSLGSSSRRTSKDGLTYMDKGHKPHEDMQAKEKYSSTLLKVNNNNNKKSCTMRKKCNSSDFNCCIYVGVMCV